MSMGSCPNGGQWYTCTDQDPAFFGCCTSDPCNGSGCPTSDLRAAGMGSGSGPDYSSDDGSYYQNEQCTYGQWWTCADQTPSFQGCCLTDPCQGDGTGCPDGQLYPAAFASVASASSSAAASSTSKLQSKSKTTTTSSSAARSSTTTSSSSSTTDLAASLTSSPTPTPTPVPSTSLTHAQVRAIAGGAAGGAVFIFLLLALCLTWYRAKKSRKAHTSQPPLRPAPSPFPPEMSQSQPTPRTPLPYLQTDLGKTQARQRTCSTYSAYSPNHITPSSFGSQHSILSAKENLVGREGRSHSGDEAYYPGRPIFGVPHAIKTPDAIAQPDGRRSLGSGSASSTGPSPPPTFISQPHSPNSPTVREGSWRASYNYSYPIHDGGASVAPAAAVGARGSQRRSSIQQYDPRARPTVRQVRSEGGMAAYDPRRRSEPAPQPIYETPDSFADCMPDLPESPTNAAENRWRERRRPVGSLRVRTTSGSAVDWSESGRGRGSGSWSAGPTVESINAIGRGWGGDMRTDWERQRDREREREGEGQRQAGMGYTSWQTMAP